MSATPIAKLSNLAQALLFDSPEHVTRFDRQTGRIVLVELKTHCTALDSRTSGIGIGMKR